MYLLVFKLGVKLFNNIQLIAILSIHFSVLGAIFIISICSIISSNLILKNLNLPTLSQAAISLRTCSIPIQTLPPHKAQLMNITCPLASPTFCVAKTILDRCLLSGEWNIHLTNGWLSTLRQLFYLFYCPFHCCVLFMFGLSTAV